MKPTAPELSTSKEKVIQNISRPKNLKNERLMLGIPII
jgi:hypothetical protein